MWWRATGGSGILFESEKGSEEFCKGKLKHCMDFSVLYFKREGRVSKKIATCWEGTASRSCFLRFTG